MSQFPIEPGDQQGVVDGLNYVLSGPGGLGQNFEGFSAYETGYLTGNFRRPYGSTAPESIYVPPISCSSAEQIDDRTFQYNFTSAQPAAPFKPGNNTFGAGWTNTFYNGGSGAIGVVQCTTTFVIIRTAASYPGIGDDLTGGTIEYDANDQLNSTDSNARVTVTGGTDRVFISAQLSNIMSYVSSTGGDLTYTVEVNRYVGFPNNDPINPDFLFDFDRTVSRKVYQIDGITGTGLLTEIETVFSTVIDQPPPGYFWYILEVLFEPTGDLKIDQAEFNLRSLSAQVVKE
jgi:hypothetical protein